MPSGYEKSDDYGGPDPAWRGIMAIVVVIGIAALAVLIVRQWQ
ncbi:hypothetical protein [Ancylobacter sp. TS-1]|nr:hypothetical protein [Ancylobacter sp. TS-1]